MAVAVAVVADLGVAAVIAPIDMATEGRGAASLDGVQGAALREARAVALAVGAAHQACDVGQLERRRVLLFGEFAADLRRAEGTAPPCRIARCATLRRRMRFCANRS